MGQCVSTYNHSVAVHATQSNKGGISFKDGEQKPASLTPWVHQVLDKPTADVRTLYDFGKVLSRDDVSTTYLVLDKLTGEELSCKSISKRKLITIEDTDNVQREIQVLYQLVGHPNIVNMKGAYEDRNHVHIITEICQGGELFDRVVDGGHYLEHEAAEAIQTILQVVQHCHNMGVLHRDLCPGNFLLTDGDDTSSVKATGFGLATFFRDNKTFDDVVGRSYLLAPEVLCGCYSKEADVWSCGVLLYMMLCGSPPFYGDTEQDVFASIMQGMPNFETGPWKTISEPAKDCVRSMLVRNPAERPSAAQVLQHEWLLNLAGGIRAQELEPEVIQRIRSFAAMNRLKKEAVKIVAAKLPQDETRGMQEMFHAMDTDRSGAITVDELRDSLRAKGSRIPEHELQRIIANADINGDGRLDYNEFIAATMHTSKLHQEQHLYAAFQVFDKDGNGYITADELQAALKEHGDAASVAEHVRDILAEVDKNSDGRINYEEFCTMMRHSDDRVLRAASTLKYRYGDGRLRKFGDTLQVRDHGSSELEDD